MIADAQFVANLHEFPALGKNVLFSKRNTAHESQGGEGVLAMRNLRVELVCPILGLLISTSFIWTSEEFPVDKYEI